MPTIVDDIRDLESFVDVPLGTGRWEEITQERINAFAEATGDRQWIHIDVERAARESSFGTTIAHGYLTIALVPVLLAELLIVKGAGTIVNAGFDKLRLPAPVRAGSKLRLGATIKHVRDMPKGGARVTFGLRIEVEGQARAACVADAIYVYFP